MIISPEMRSDVTDSCYLGRNTLVPFYQDMESYEDLLNLLNKHLTHWANKILSGKRRQLTSIRLSSLDSEIYAMILGILISFF